MNTTLSLSPARLTAYPVCVLLLASAPVLAQGGADPSDDAFRMGSPPALPEGLTEEDMWPAATAEGWKQPVLVTWQRTFADAMSVARAENRPVLVAVNMDGEIASEHFAGVRYRTPETAALLEPYVSVIASVYRHTPRDYDEDGNRVECPRFGTVTCGEHIDAERQLYDIYFDGNRVAPRHIVLDLEGNETTDVYFAWDTKTVITTFVKSIEGWPEPTDRGELTLQDMAKSARVEHRETVERAYVEGDREARREILRTLLEEREVDQVEVLRTAIFGLDMELAQLAQRALARCDTEGALDLMAEALKGPLDASERELILATVAELGEGSKRARTLAALHSGLAQRSSHIEPPDAESLARAYEANAAAALDVRARARAAEARPEEPGALLELAESLLARAQDSDDPLYPTLWLEDARESAREAERLGASGPRLDAVLATTAAGLRDWRTARTRAVAAVEAGLLRSGADSVTGTQSETTRATVLRLFVEARRRAIRAAYRAGDEWPPEWLSDVNAAHAVLSEAPGVDERFLVEHHDFLRWIGASARADEALDEAFARFPDSAVLHERLRARLLWDAGPAGLERGYAERLANAGEEPTQLTWFAGYASLVAAEHYRRRSEFDEALGAYERGIAFYGRNAGDFPAGRDTCDHFVALALAGQARIALERGERDTATRQLVAALELRPGSAATADGLGLTPIATAKMLHARLVEAGNEASAARVQAALDALPAELLEPPPSERMGSGRRRG